MISENSNQPEPTPPATEAKAGAVPVPTPLPDHDDAMVDIGSTPHDADHIGASKSQISGPLSGAPIVAWTDLMNTHSEINIDLDDPDSIEFDAEADRDLLNRVFPGEPPSNGLPSTGDDIKELSPEDFHDLVGGSSHAFGTTPSSIRSRNRDDSSNVDLLGARRGDVEIPEDGASSALDLGSESCVNLPNGSAKNGRHSDRKPRPKHAVPTPDDSGTVDLLGGRHHGNGLSSVPGLTALGSGLRRDKSLPSTTKFGDRIARHRRILDMLFGAATTFAVFVGLWLSGAIGPSRAAVIIPEDLAITPAPDPALVQTQTELKNARTALASLRDSLRSTNLDPDNLSVAIAQVRANQADLEHKLETAKADTAKASASLQTAEAQRLQVQGDLAKAEQARQYLDDELKKTKLQLAAMKPADPSAEMVQLKDERRKLEAKSQKLEDQLAAANKMTELTRQMARDSTAFVTSVRQRLQATPGAAPADVLAALEQALAPKPAPGELGHLPPAYSNDSRAERAFACGMSQYRAGNLFNAECYFQSATELNDRDARFWYFLGLTRTAMGRWSEAETDFRKGVDRERRNWPNPSAMDALLERLPSDARQSLSRVRGR